MLSSRSGPDQTEADRRSVRADRPDRRTDPRQFPPPPPIFFIILKQIGHFWDKKHCFEDFILLKNHFWHLSIYFRRTGLLRGGPDFWEADRTRTGQRRCTCNMKHKNTDSQISYIDLGGGGFTPPGAKFGGTRRQFRARAQVKWTFGVQKVRNSLNRARNRLKCIPNASKNAKNAKKTKRTFYTLFITHLLTRIQFTHVSEKIHQAYNHRIPMLSARKAEFFAIVGPHLTNELVM